MSETEGNGIKARIEQIHLMRESVQKVLPGHVSVDKFLKVAELAARDPKILQAEWPSVAQAILYAAQAGLLLDGKESALSPMNKNLGTREQPRYVKWCRFAPMVYGIMKLARNSGELGSIVANVVHENDQFRYWIDDNGEHVEHTPDPFGDRGKVVGVYAQAKLKDGTTMVECMNLDEVEKCRKVSSAKDSGPWKTWWSEMAKKTPIRRLSKRLPMSTDLEHAVKADDDLVDFSALDGDREAKPADGPPKSRARAAVEAAGYGADEPEPPAEPEKEPEPEFPDDEEVPL